MNKCLLFFVYLLVFKIKIGPKVTNEGSPPSFFFLYHHALMVFLLHLFSVSMDYSTYFVFQSVDSFFFEGYVHFNPCLDSGSLFSSGL